MAQLVSTSASDTNSKVWSYNPAGNKKSFSIAYLNFKSNWNTFKIIKEHALEKT